MSYSKVELEGLQRAHLYKLCKQTGVSTFNYAHKRPKTNVLIIHDLAEYFSSVENDLKELEEGLIEEDLNTTWTIDDSKEKEEDDAELKETILKEVERMAEENLSKIPRFVADGVVIPTMPAESTTPVAVAKETERNSYGVKLDSIDHYLAKKRKRAEDQLNYNDKFKENILPSKKLRPSKSGTALKKITGIKRKSIKIDDEITVNNLPKIKSPKALRRVSPRLRFSMFNEKSNSRVKPILASSRRTMLPGSIRKVKISKDVKRFSLAGLSTPSFLTVDTPKTKATPKFDIKASLKKPLNYKPHTGKLRETYLPDRLSIGVPRKLPANKEKIKVDRNVSVKELTKNNTTTTREKRRNAATTKRGKNRDNVLDKRRGIEC